MLLADVIQRGTRAAQPAASAVADGTLYYVTDEGVTERSNHSAWQTFTDGGGLTLPGSSTDNAIARWNGTGGNSLQNSTPIVQDDGRISSVTDPSSGQDAATKTYVDGIAANLGKRGRVRAATSANVTISTALNNGDTIDGVTLATGDLVLVKSQSAQAENGVYVVGVSPARAAEFDTYDEHPGSLLAVAEGTLYADTIWLCTSNAGGVLNTNAIVFSQITTGATVADSTVTGRAKGAGSGSRQDLTPAEVREIIALGAGPSCTFDGGGGVLTAKTAYMRMPYGMTVTGWEIVADVSGSAVVDVWKDVYANFPPTSGDSIAGSEKPTLSSQQKNTDTSLSTWTTTINAGDWLAFDLSGIATVTWVHVALIGTRTT